MHGMIKLEAYQEIQFILIVEDSGQVGIMLK